MKLVYIKFSAEDEAPEQFTTALEAKEFITNNIGDDKKVFIAFSDDPGATKDSLEFNEFQDEEAAREEVEKGLTAPANTTGNPQDPAAGSEQGNAGGSDESEESEDSEEESE